MITFFIALAVLILGYFVYGKLIEKLFGADPQRATPATTMADGVDYVPMKPWRIFLIQFLNIAGVGPIIGAIMGAQFGTASFLWIVLGSIFAGAVHDYLAGMISLRDKGASLPEIHGTYLGNGAKQVMRAFTIILMILVGVVFVNTPATLLNANFTQGWNPYIWIIIILVYYLIATLLPIDKLIGKIYPIFGILLLGMAVAIFVAFLIYKPEIPELWSGMQNRHPDAANNPIFPMMFISIACGAISGFHATQSPLMARCMVNEKQGRPIFYGAMITEGVVALIWAAAAAYFFGPNSVVDVTGKSGAAIVGVIANTWFTPVIATITILGVISAAVTSGDTALRSARLIIADFMHYDQKPIKNRLIVAVPMFVVTAAILVYSISDAKGFQVIWRYFAWAGHSDTLGYFRILGQEQRQVVVSYHPHPGPLHDHGDGMFPLCGQGSRWRTRFHPTPPRRLRHWCSHHSFGIGAVCGVFKEKPENHLTMRKFALILSIIAGLSFLSACNKVDYNGQTGKILHEKYDPALNINYLQSDDSAEQTWDTLRIDLDQDDITDLKVYFEFDIPFIRAMGDWQICILSKDDLYIVDSYWWGKGIHVFYDSVHPIAVVHSTEEGSYYGWLDAYSFVGSDGQQNIIRFYLRETAFCTCLNYPLKWGEK